MFETLWTGKHTHKLFQTNTNLSNFRKPIKNYRHFLYWLLKMITFYNNHSNLLLEFRLIGLYVNSHLNISQNSNSGNLVLIFWIKGVKGTEKFKKSGEHAIKFIELNRIACSPNFLNFSIPLRSFLFHLDDLHPNVCFLFFEIKGVKGKEKFRKSGETRLNLLSWLESHVHPIS